MFIFIRLNINSFMREKRGGFSVLKCNILENVFKRSVNTMFRSVHVMFWRSLQLLQGRSSQVRVKKGMASLSIFQELFLNHK